MIGSTTQATELPFSYSAFFNKYEPLILSDPCPDDLFTDFLCKKACDTMPVEFKNCKTEQQLLALLTERKQEQYDALKNALKEKPNAISRLDFWNDFFANKKYNLCYRQPVITDTHQPYPTMHFNLNRNLALKVLSDNVTPLITKNCGIEPRSLINVQREYNTQDATEAIIDHHGELNQQLFYTYLLYSGLLHLR